MKKIKEDSIDKATQTFIEIEAKTASEAINIALKKLGLKKSEADIKVLREEQKGLFEMQGTTLAKVRVSKRLQIR